MKPPPGHSRLAITAGDPAGIGFEVVVKALHQLDPDEHSMLAITLFGDPRGFAAAGFEARRFPTVTTHATGDHDFVRHGIGRPSAASGRAAADTLLAAIDAAMKDEVDGIVTAPLSKEALALAGHPWPGQTEVLIERSGAARGVMLFVGGGLKVALATRHVALKDVPGWIRASDVDADLAILHDALVTRFGIARPRLAVTGVNPHAGEHGLFGTEEADVLAPALASARARGADVAGPLPADTAFVRHRKGEFDAVLAMYHDQGLIPVKLLAFGGGVNVTLGLLFVRTSPDHGTAFDIAGRGIADPGSTVEAIRLAAQLSARRSA